MSVCTSICLTEISDKLDRLIYRNKILYGFGWPYTTFPKIPYTLQRHLNLYILFNLKSIFLVILWNFIISEIPRFEIHVIPEKLKISQSEIQKCNFLQNSEGAFFTDFLISDGGSFTFSVIACILNFRVSVIIKFHNITRKIVFRFQNYIKSNVATVHMES